MRMRMRMDNATKTIPRSHAVAHGTRLQAMDAAARGLPAAAEDEVLLQQRDHATMQQRNHTTAQPCNSATMQPATCTFRVLAASDRPFEPIG
jgi:hypothetical protein